jgi:hypothetical protein
MRPLALAALIGAGCAAAVSPASATVTYTFTGSFQNSNFNPPNASFSITTSDFITSDQTFTAAQSNLACGDSFVQCTGVSFLTDASPGQDAITINFNTATVPETEFFYFDPTAFTTTGVFSQNPGPF